MDSSSKTLTFPLAIRSFYPEGKEDHELKLFVGSLTDTISALEDREIPFTYTFRETVIVEIGGNGENKEVRAIKFDLVCPVATHERRGDLAKLLTGHITSCGGERRNDSGRYRTTFLEKSLSSSNTCREV